jgi:hypothetical protein
MQSIGVLGYVFKAFEGNIGEARGGGGGSMGKALVGRVFSLFLFGRLTCLGTIETPPERAPLNLPVVHRCNHQECMLTGSVVHCEKTAQTVGQS